MSAGEQLRIVDPKEYTVVHVAAFYENDGQDGLAVSWDFAGDTGNRFSAWCESVMLTFEAMDGKPSQAKAWLDALGRTHPKPEITRALGSKIVATIHWLERRGHLVSDEFNGCMWMARCHRLGTHVALRFDEPSAENLRKLESEIPRMHLDPLDKGDFERLLRDVLHTEPSQ